VPKLVRELWIGASASVKCSQVDGKEIRFALPANTKGQAGCGSGGRMRILKRSALRIAHTRTKSVSVPPLFSGYMGCALKFDVDKAMRSFQSLVSSYGARALNEFSVLF